jgi:large subunit ribosomal protein L30
MAGKLIVRQIRSTIGRPERQRLVLRALGLRRIGHQREHQDNPVVRGMIRKVNHLVEVREADQS